MGDKFSPPRVEKKEKYPTPGWRLVSHPVPDSGFLYLFKKSMLSDAAGPCLNPSFFNFQKSEIGLLNKLARAG